jgi:hypothetical protein
MTLQQERYNKIVIELGSATVSEEWKYFEEWARRFDQNEPAKRYGILIMGEIPSEANMIYSEDVLELRVKHLEALSGFGTGSPGAKQRKFLNWLEKVEGKA